MPALFRLCNDAHLFRIVAPDADQPGTRDNRPYIRRRPLCSMIGMKSDYAQRQAHRAAYRVERDAHIREAVKAGVPLAVLGARYQLTRERIRQIGKAPTMHAA